MEAERELDEERAGALQGRRRLRGSADPVEHFFSSVALSVSPPSLLEEGGGGGEAERDSVYFDRDEGAWKCRHCTWTYWLNGGCQMLVDVELITLLESYGSLTQAQSAGPVEISDTISKNDDQNALWKEKATEKTDSDGKTSNYQKDISAEEAFHMKTMELENGLNLQHYSATHERGFAEIDDEIEVLEETAIIRKCKSKVTEFDLEKVLEEQDTYDLYCPNCNSCITKRVILRKRKRLLTEIQNDVPTKKVHEEQCDTRKSASDAISDEMTNLTDSSEPDIFRCLSCFSFFIPRDGGFNIFQIFKKGKDVQLQSSGQVLGKKTNWITYFLNLDTTKKEGSKQGTSNLNEPSTVSEGVDESMQNEKVQPTPEFKIGILKSEETHITSQINDTDIMVNGSSSILLEEHTVGQTKPYPSSTLIKSTPSDIVQTIDLPDAAVFLTDVRIWSDAGTPNLNEPYTVSEGVDESIQNEKVQPTPEFKTGILKSEETHITSQINDTDIMVNGSSSILLEEEHTVGQTKPYASSTLIKSTSSDIVQTIDFPGAAVFLTDVRIWSDAGQEPIQVTSQINPTIHGSEAVSIPVLEQQTDVRINVAEPIVRDTEINNELDVLKSIVYGGLIESLTSLGVVSSAAASGAATLSILALGLANLVGGFLVIIHNLYELRNAQDASAGQEQERSGRYWELLGWRRNFRLQFILAITSYIVFGLLPPVVYCFSFRISDNKEYKLIAVAAASFLCIALLAIGKAHVKPQKAYIKTLFYYLSLAVSTSAISYVVGVMIKRLLEKLGLFAHSSTAPSTLFFQDLSQRLPTWASY